LIIAIGLTPGGSSTLHTHKQYTEQHNETEYTNKIIKLHNLQNLTEAYKTYNHIHKD